MGATIPWESRLELHDLYRVEVDPAICSYGVQPETLYWRNGEMRRRYTPDRLDVLADGSERIIEVKDVFDPAADPDYTEKLSQAALIYKALGRSFEIRDGAAIRSEPSFSAFEEVQAYRRAIVTVDDIAGIQRCLRSRPLPICEVLRSMRGAHPRPTLFALMTRRVVSIDLTFGLKDATLVSLIESAQR